MVTIPQARLRNFSIIAHVDHGKSTLADRILELTHTIEARQMTSQVLDSMDLEREKGITIKARAVRLEYLAKDGLAYGLNLIDTPGHVDFSYEVSRSLQACEGAILVVDAAQGIEAQTLANVHLALAQGLVIVPVINKIDLPSAQPEVVMQELEDVLAIPREEVILVSAKDGTNVDLVLEAIVERVPAPTGDPDAPVRGLIFDSHYDAYKGVVAYVRLAEGTLHARENIRLMQSGVEVDVLELGMFRPAARARSIGWAQARSATSPRVSRASATARWGTRSPPPPTRRPTRCRDTSRRARSCSRASIPSTAPTIRCCGTRSRSSISTTRPSPTSPRARSRSDLASAADSWACCTWRSSRNASSASSTSTSSRPRPSVEYHVTLTNGRGEVSVDNPSQAARTVGHRDHRRAVGQGLASSPRRQYIGTLMDLAQGRRGAIGDV